MENNKILAAALLAISLMPLAASAATAEPAATAPTVSAAPTAAAASTNLTVGEVQLLKNQAATLKNQKAVNDLKKKLEDDATPPKADIDTKKLGNLPMPPLPNMPAIPGAVGGLGLPVSIAPKMAEFCTGYNAILIRGSSDDDKSALIVGKDRSEIFVKKGTVLSDGCIIEKINDQSLVVRSPSKGKKANGKLYTVLLGADQSNLIKPAATPNMNALPTMPAMPMMNGSQQQNSSSQPYAGY